MFPKKLKGWQAFLVGILCIPILLFDMACIRLYLMTAFVSIYYGEISTVGMIILAVGKIGMISGYFVSRWLIMNLSLE